MDFIKDTINNLKLNDDDPGPRPVPDSPDWCRCGVCRPMPTEEENKCCGKRLCVTSYQTFRDGCINRHALELAIKSRSDMRVEQFEFTTNDYRKAAYRQFVAWKYGRLGQGVRKINPSCVVLMVRQAYPSNEYMGFRPH